MKVQRSVCAGGTMKGESGSSFSCSISKGPALSHSLKWPGRRKQNLQNRDFVGGASHNPHLAANRFYFPLHQVDALGERRQRGRRADMQHRQPNGWWRRTMFGTLAGAASIRIMSLKYPWLLLSELFSLSCFRRDSHQNPKESVERKNWWHLPVKVATAISSRFCSSLSNSVVATHLLLLIFELRSMIDSEHSTDSGITALTDSTLVGRKCCSCLASYNEDGTGVEHSILSRPSKTCCFQSCEEFAQSLIGSTTLELKGGHHPYVQPPLNLREDISRMLVIERKGREVKDKSPHLMSKEDIVHSAELIHAAVSMRKNSLGELLHAEPPVLTPSSEVQNSCDQEDSQVFISFVSNNFPEEIELVFPQCIRNNEDSSCIEAVTMDPHTQSAQLASIHFVEGYPRASENSALLKSILMDKCKNDLVSSSKSTVYVSDVESEYFFEACSMSLPDVEHSEHEQSQELDPSSENFEGWRSTYSDALIVHENDHSLMPEKMAGQDSQNSFDFDCLGDQAVKKIQSEGESLTHNRADTDLNVHPPLLSSSAECEEKMNPSVSTCAPLHFADHPICISLRERRHEYGDQNYMIPDELSTSSLRELVFWHGHCRQGNPTLCILLGRAVQHLPAGELQTISSVIISQMEYAEMNLFNGSAKQMNIIMDLWGIGLMRMPPLEILSHVGMIMNRDYAGRGASIILVNAPMMLSLVIGAIKRVILRPAYNKGALIEKGFLEKKDRIFFFNRNYKHALEKHYDLTLLPLMFGGKCTNKFCPQDCNLGGNFLLRR